MPPHAVAGECYAKVFVPAQFETMSERVCVREASERLEIIPARYEWVEERILVKDASTQLEEVPANFEFQDRTVEVACGHTGWVMEKSGRCRTESGQPASDVFCLVTTPPVSKTIRTQRVAKAACVHEVAVPAQYETVRREKLASAATTRKISIPAEYQDIEKSRQVAAGRMEWQRVVCDANANAETANAVKVALAVAGYDPGPLNGERDESYRVALTAYQQDNGLGVGQLSYETLSKLGVSPK
ncbi:MAG TPA: peptidoglycan-binding domain-containing protein [Phycisphaerae bacterium]